MDKSFMVFTVLILAVLLFASVLGTKTVKKVFGRFGSVRVDSDATRNQWAKSWPAAINLRNSVGSNARFPVAGSYRNASGYPYAIDDAVPRPRIRPQRRTFSWVGDELTISVNLTSLGNPTCTRLTPPLSWLSASEGSKVKIHQTTATDVDASSTETPRSENSDVYESPSMRSRILEVSVKRSQVDSSLSALSMYGFSREAIFRMLDKGPWVLAFSLSQTLPRVFHDIQVVLGYDQAAAVHILSHCPYIIAQYDRYKGRDLSATVKALEDIGYPPNSLRYDLMRFPSMLAAPPERILGWMSLLTGFGIANGEKGPFGKFIKRAPFMFNLNPPPLFDEAFGFGSSGIHDNPDVVTTTASDYVVSNALQVLNLMADLKVPDLDKIFRTDPNLLLVPVDELARRMDFIMQTVASNDVNVSRVITWHRSQQKLDRLTFVKEDPQYPVSEDSATEGDLTDVQRGQYRSNDDENIDRDKASASSSASQLDVDSAVQSSASTSAVQGKSAWKKKKISTAAERQLRDIGTPFGSVGHTGVNGSGRIAQLSYGAPGLFVDPDVDPEEVAYRQLLSVVLAYPKVLSSTVRVMQRSTDTLLGMGLLNSELVGLVKRNPAVLGRKAEELKNCVRFLIQYCGLSKASVVPFVLKNPAILSTSHTALRPRVDYLFKSLEGSLSMLRRFPNYLLYDLDTHTRPRAEFLRALGKKPLDFGLPFLVQSSPKSLAATLEIEVATFSKFKKSFDRKWKEYALREKFNIQQESSAAEDGEDGGGWDWDTFADGSGGSSTIRKVDQKREEQINSTTIQ